MVILLWYYGIVKEQAFFYRLQGGEIMPITYEKMRKLMEEKGINSYTAKRDKIIGQATLKKIKEDGDIDTRTIAKMCEVLDCQPGDLMEYVKDSAEE